MLGENGKNCLLVLLADEAEQLGSAAVAISWPQRDVAQAPGAVGPREVEEGPLLELRPEILVEDQGDAGEGVGQVSPQRILTPPSQEIVSVREFLIVEGQPQGRRGGLLVEVR